MKGFAVGLVLKQRYTTTRKWLIASCLLNFVIQLKNLCLPYHTKRNFFRFVQIVIIAIWGQFNCRVRL